LVITLSFCLTLKYLSF